MNKAITTITLALLSLFTLAAQAAENIKPQIGESLRAPSICVGPDQTYYLTGTTGVEGKNGKPDFNNCRGMRVWSSKDLKNWTDLGLVWDRWNPKQNFTTHGSPNLHRGWGAYQGELLPLPGLTPGERACGMTAPRLTFHDGRFWAGYSVSGFAAGVMSSEKPDINGPWEDHRLMVEAHGAETDRSDAQVFVDKNGTRFLLWGGGCLAKLRPRDELIQINRSDAGYSQVGVEGAVQYLPALIEGFPGDDGLPEHGDPYGVFLFLDGDDYLFVFTATTYRDGGMHEDSYLCRARQLSGPWSKPELIIPDGGRCTLFSDPSRTAQVVYSTAEHQPVISPLPQGRKPALSTTSPAVRREVVTRIPLPPRSEKPADVTQDVEMIEPLFDHPLRDAAICKGGDGNWYMVGTEATRDSDGKLDWANNNGIRLWRSKDMTDWQDLGYVWDCDKNGSQWHTSLHLDRACGASPRLGRAVTAPEIHYLKDTYCMVYSMNGQGIGILKSKTGKPEGPYEDLGQLTRQGRDPSLFQDSDGAVHLVWGNGFAAKLNETMTAINGPVQTLFTNVDWYPRYLRRIEVMGQWGSHLTKAGDWYIWNFTTRTGRSGVNSIDTLASWSKSLDGPWGEPCLMLVNGGQSTLVPDGTGRFFATVSGEDEYAQCPYVPAITEVKNFGETLADPKGSKPLDTIRGYGKGGFQSWFFSAISAKATELDFWIGNPKFIDVGLRDVWCGQLDDSGYYYLTGSFWSQKRWKDKVAFYRSKDLIHWEAEPGAIMTLEELKKHPDFNWESYNRAVETCKKNAAKWGRDVADMFTVEMAETKALRTRDGNVYVIVFAFNAGSFLLKSESKTMAGPFNIVRGGIPFGTMEQAEDGGILVNLPAGIAKSPPEQTVETVDFRMSKHQFRHERNLCMEEDCEVGVFQIDGKWVTWSADWNGNYDMQYRMADSLEGPWRNLRVGAPHGGNGDIFQRADGSWWYAGFYNCNDYATRIGDPTVFTRLYIMPLYVGWHGDELIIEPKAARANRARLEQLGMLWQSPRMEANKKTSAGAVKP